MLQFIPAILAAAAKAVPVVASTLASTAGNIGAAAASTAGNIGATVGQAGLSTLGTAGNALGTAMSTVAQPVAQGIGYVGKNVIGPSLGYAKEGAKFVGPPQKFSLNPALSKLGESAISYGVSNAMAPKPQGPAMPLPTVSYQPQYGDPGPSKYASELSPEAYKSVSRRLQNQYGGFRI